MIIITCLQNAGKRAGAKNQFHIRGGGGGERFLKGVVFGGVPVIKLYVKYLLTHGTVLICQILIR